MKWSRKLWLRMNPDRPRLMFAFKDGGVFVCPICGRAMKAMARAGDNRRHLNRMYVPQRGNAERHLDACFSKQLEGGA